MALLFLIQFRGIFNTEICADNGTSCSTSALARETKSKQNYFFSPKRLTKMVRWTRDLVKSVWFTSWRCENVDSSGGNCKAIQTSCSSCFFAGVTTARSHFLACYYYGVTVASEQEHKRFLPECNAFSQSALRHFLPECIAPRTTRGCHTVEPFLMQQVQICKCGRINLTSWY